MADAILIELRKRGGANDCYGFDPKDQSLRYGWMSNMNTENRYGRFVSSSRFDDDTLIGFPWPLDQGNDAPRIRKLPDQPRKLLSIANPVRSKVLHQSIMDIMCFEERLFTDKAMLLLANGLVITEVTVGMHGTGYAGLWCFDSIDDLSSRWGTNYRRLVC